MAQVTEALPTVETAKKLGLLPEEYDRICEILNRPPNFTELSIFSVMWSEHCSYKNSIVWLKKLPKDSPKMLAKAGEENAGLVDLGEGIACAFKIESHNHPSALEPYQGAATGVGDPPWLVTWRAGGFAKAGTCPGNTTAGPPAGEGTVWA